MKMFQRFPKGGSGVARLQVCVWGGGGGGGGGVVVGGGWCVVCGGGSGGWRVVCCVWWWWWWGGGWWWVGGGGWVGGWRGRGRRGGGGGGGCRACAAVWWRARTRPPCSWRAPLPCARGQGSTGVPWGHACACACLCTAGTARRCDLARPRTRPAPAPRQVLLFSATLHSPEVRALAGKICQNPIIIDLKGKDAVPEAGGRRRACVKRCGRRGRCGAAARLG